MVNGEAHAIIHGEWRRGPLSPQTLRVFDRMLFVRFMTGVSGDTSKGALPPARSQSISDSNSPLLQELLLFL